MRQPAKIFVFCICLFCFFASSALAVDIFKFKQKTIKVDGRVFRTLVADTPEKREQGLSYTDSENLKRRGIDGMLFVFDTGDEKEFQAWYMKYDLIMLGLEKKPGETYTVIDRKVLRIGTVLKVKGKYVLEIPLANNTLTGGGK